MRRGSPKILIVKLSAIGDVVHTLPALNALRKHYPRAHITWLVEEAAAGLLAGHAALDRILISRRKAWVAGLRTRNRATHIKQVLTFFKQLRDTRYDLILDFQAALKGAMLIALARGHSRIGFGPGMEHQERSYLVLSRKIPMVSMEIHALDRGLLMLQALGVPCDVIEYRLPVDAKAHGHTTALINAAPALAGKKPVAINPVAQWDSKLWPADRFAKLADKLIENEAVSVYFTGGRGDRSAIKEIINKMRHPAVNLAGRTSLIDLAALYQKMACVISTDTGPMHIAAAVNTPVVALFGPTAEWRTGPYGSDHRVVTANCPCRPCFKRTCPSPECMRDISVEQVWDQVQVILKKENNR